MGTHPDREMGWKTYAAAFLLFNLLGLLVVYGLQRLQGVLPLNPESQKAVPPASPSTPPSASPRTPTGRATAARSTLSYLVQMLGLTVQNFVSAASGMAVMAAFVRGFARHNTRDIGNFWADLVRGTLYILLPLSIVLSAALISQGVVQTLHPSQQVTMVQSTTDADGAPVATQSIPVGPAASQIAIKQLGTNGGGYFGANSSHPFENPTPLSNAWS